MENLAGVKYIKDSNGFNRYLRIDLKKYSDNQLIDDFLDALEIMAKKDEETISLEELNQYIDSKLKMNV